MFIIRLYYTKLLKNKVSLPLICDAKFFTRVCSNFFSLFMLFESKRPLSFQYDLSCIGIEILCKFDEILYYLLYNDESNNFPSSVITSYYLTVLVHTKITLSCQSVILILFLLDTSFLFRLLV